jgi:hypothetical protein
MAALSADSMGPIVTSQPAPIVVGVDDSERSRDALALATRLADPGQLLLMERNEIVRVMG